MESILHALHIHSASGAGALALWATSDAATRRVFGLSEIYERAFKDKPDSIFYANLITFVLFGAVVVSFVIEPVNTNQAFTSGLAWSYLLSRTSSGIRNKNVKN